MFEKANSFKPFPVFLSFKKEESAFLKVPDMDAGELAVTYGFRITFINSIALGLEIQQAKLS